MVTIIVSIVVAGLIIGWLYKPARTEALQELQRQNRLLSEQNELARETLHASNRDRCTRDGHDWEWHEGGYGMCSRPGCRKDHEEWADEQCVEHGHVWVDEDGDDVDDCDRCGISRECLENGHGWEYSYDYLKSSGWDGSRYCERCDRLQYEKEGFPADDPWSPPPEVLAKRDRGAPS